MRYSSSVCSSSSFTGGSWTGRALIASGTISSSVSDSIELGFLLQGGKLGKRYSRFLLTNISKAIYFSNRRVWYSGSEVSVNSSGFWVCRKVSRVFSLYWVIDQIGICRTIFHQSRKSVSSGLGL